MSGRKKEKKQTTKQDGEMAFINRTAYISQQAE